MSEPQDPYAGRPYVPPGQRDEEPTTRLDAGSDAATSDTTRFERPGPDAPAQHDVTAEQPAAEQSTTQQPAAADWSTPAAPAASAAGAPAGPPADDAAWTHRYSDHAAQQPAPAAAGALAAEKHDRPRRGGLLVAGLVGAALIGTAAGFGGAALYAANDDGGSSSPTVSSLAQDAKASDLPAGTVEKVAEAVMPSVVQINVGGNDASGTGTGVILSSDGEILTNNHVVESAADGGTITVSFDDGSLAKAAIMGRDPKTDLAVIKAEGKTGLTPATLGSSAALRVGQEVVAIGSPYGLESTVTSGIVSALNRPVTSADATGSNSTVFPAVQTDAAINPGNSGGPLVDADGRVIGINSAIRTSSGGESGSIGLGFAIPIDLAKNVASQLVEGKTVEHARIGVTVTPAVESDGITTVGAQVREVSEGSAGDKAGLEVGDVITAVGGNAVGSSDALVAAIRGYQPGDKVEVTYVRDGKTQTTDVTLDSDGGDLSS
ncbi:trypsin-like peptidase domain-containing protein [Aeromicrobium sp. IC_218]|uniref:S1C family serine protease n=1 Tax=Aeromicrobium sp. IC_218 TaxID=2545468 RepID=UPI00103D21A2|nr:trypsin-like peptidase domain-containing protein [Aeromicrobium sp. IC_218]TCI99382.1 PDZ domain-containing protein [Aeromicrobium sp. IC_218]